MIDPDYRVEPGQEPGTLEITGVIIAQESVVLSQHHAGDEHAENCVRELIKRRLSERLMGTHVKALREITRRFFQERRSDDREAADEALIEINEYINRMLE